MPGRRINRRTLHQAHYWHASLGLGDNFFNWTTKLSNPIVAFVELFSSVCFKQRFFAEEANSHWLHLCNFSSSDLLPQRRLLPLWGFSPVCLTFPHCEFLDAIAFLSTYSSGWPRVGAGWVGGGVFGFWR